VDFRPRGNDMSLTGKVNIECHSHASGNPPYSIAWLSEGRKVGITENAKGQQRSFDETAQAPPSSRSTYTMAKPSKLGATNLDSQSASCLLDVKRLYFRFNFRKSTHEGHE